MIDPNEAAALLNVSSRVIYYWIEDGSVHFIDEPGGLLVCEASLSAHGRSQSSKLLL